MSEASTEFHRLVQIYCEILQVTKPTTLLTSLRYDTSQQRLTEDTITRKTFTPDNVTELEHIVEQRLQILSREQKLTLRKRLWRKNIMLPNLFP